MFFNISIIVYISKMHHYGALLSTKLNPERLLPDIPALVQLWFHHPLLLKADR